MVEFGKSDAIVENETMVSGAQWSSTRVIRLINLADLGSNDGLSMPNSSCDNERAIFDECVFASRQTDELHNSRKVTPCNHNTSCEHCRCCCCGYAQPLSPAVLPKPTQTGPWKRKRPIRTTRFTVSETAIHLWEVPLFIYKI